VRGVALLRCIPESKANPWMAARRSPSPKGQRGVSAKSVFDKVLSEPRP